MNIYIVMQKTTRIMIYNLKTAVVPLDTTVDGGAWSDLCMHGTILHE